MSMLNLTPEERQVILFLIAVTIIGLGLNFAIKKNTRIKSFVISDINIAKINLNQVSLEDLLHSYYLTPKLAQKITEYRSLHGPFHALEELKEIKGIGENRYQKLKELFFVE